MKLEEVRYEALDKNTKTQARANSIFFLGEIKDKIIVDGLITSYEDADERIKHEIIIALGKIRDHKAAPFLLQILQTQKFFLSEITHALASIGGNEVKEELFDIAMENNDDNIRRCALSALGEMNYNAKIEVYNGIEISDSRWR